LRQHRAQAVDVGRSRPSTSTVAGPRWQSSASFESRPSSSHHASRRFLWACPRSAPKGGPTSAAANAKWPPRTRRCGVGQGRLLSRVQAGDAEDLRARLTTLLSGPAFCRQAGPSGSTHGLRCRKTSCCSTRPSLRYDQARRQLSPSCADRVFNKSRTTSRRSDPGARSSRKTQPWPPPKKYLSLAIPLYRWCHQLLEVDHRPERRSLRRITAVIFSAAAWWTRSHSSRPSAVDGIAPNYLSGPNAAAT